MTDIFADILPPLSTEEFSALEADIKEHGVLHPVFVDETGAILDGRHRLKICPDAKRKVIRGLSAGEKEAFVFRANFVRRNLSPDQKAEARKRMKQTAAKLREEDPVKWTQRRVAEVLGVDRSTVAKWFDISIVKVHNASTTPPDARVKVTQAKKAEIAKAIAAGKSQKQLAADIGVSQQTISNVVRAEQKQRDKEKADAAAARKAAKELGNVDLNVHHGDSFMLARDIPDESCALIFTDPPYDRQSLPMFDQLAELAERILVDGGSLITYCGQYTLPDVLAKLSNRLKFFWLLSCLHTGDSAQMREYGIKVKWKPMLWFVKGKFRRDRSVWVDDLVESRQEKDAHPWQQSAVEATYYIERLTKEGELVVDPFCGGGTTAVAAMSTGRLWWTADVEKKHVMTARKRIHDANRQ